MQGASKFKNFTQSLHVHLVECSPTLQKLQHQNLKCMHEDITADKVDKRIVSTIAGTPVSWHAAFEQVPSGGKQLFSLTCPSEANISTMFLPADYIILFAWDFVAVPTIIIAHEFYDALPVHQFQVCVSKSSYAFDREKIRTKLCIA